MATATKRRRRTSRKPPPLGKTTWVTLNGGGKPVRETGYGAGPALIVAQMLAERADEPTEYTVERRDLFGTPAQLYRVVRDDDGNVFTQVLSDED